MAPGEDPAAGDPRRQGVHRHRHGERASGSPPGHPGDVTIRFKSPDDAFRVFTGQIGIAQAYAQHRFTLRGNMGLAMPLCAIVDIAEGYLFPAVLARRILKRRPKKISTARVYLAVLLGR